jgi:hypothetical protein
MGPTNSGKTYHAIESLCQAKKGSYLAPLRLLASELYDTMNNKGVKTTLLTGEEVVEVPEATHISSTIEMARLNEKFECCVIDEIQMLADSQRGWAWTRALIGLLSPEIHLCGDHTVLELVKKIISGSQFLVGSRFHALAGALSSAVPAIALGWSHKYQEIFSDFNVSDFCFMQPSLQIPAKLDELIKKAQIILLPTFIDASPVNRLYKSLSMGRYVVVNEKAVGGSALGSLCSVAGTPEVFKENTIRLFNEPFSIDIHHARIKKLADSQNDKSDIPDLLRKLKLHCQ